MDDTIYGMLSEIQELMSGQTDRREEDRIIEILEDANPGQLNDLLQQINLTCPWRITNLWYNPLIFQAL